MEHQWSTSDGGSVWLSTVCRMALEPETNDILGFLYTYDITEQRTSQEMIYTVVRLDYDYLVLLNCRTHKYIVYASKSESGTPLPPFYSDDYEAEVANYAREFLVPEDIETNIRDMSIANIRRQLRDKDSFISYAAIKEPDGRISHKKLQYSYLDRPNQRVLITRIDISDVYEKEQSRLRELQSATMAAEQANHAKTDFLSRMSHDIRTPLNAVIGLAGLGATSSSTDEMREYLQQIGASGEYLLSIINDVLDMSKIESKHMVLRPSVVFLPRFIEETVAIVMPTMVAKQIKFELKQQGIRWEYMRFDATHVRQVTVNLLSNAVKFTPAGGLVQLCLENISRSGHSVRNRMIVRDNGVGIGRDFLSKIFAPFEQENSTNDATRKGTGLGLSIVKSIVDLMGGSIRVESEKGKGTAFIVEWDLELAEAEDLPTPIVPACAQAATLEGRRVLLCEDHPLNAMIATKLLEKEGIAVTHAENGQQAADLFRGAEIGYFDAVLMDIRMPVLDGLAATRKIRSLDRGDAKTVPIIAMTANAFDEDVQESLRAGMNAHLSKPIHPQALYQTLLRFTDTGEKGVGRDE